MDSNLCIKIQYEDDDSSVVATQPVYNVFTNANLNVGTGNLSVGTYQIRPSAMQQQAMPANYILVYKNGILTVPTLATAPIVTVVNNCGSSILSTTATGSLLWSNGATTTSITVSAAANYTVTRTVDGCTSAVGIGIAAPKVLPPAPTASVTQPTCNLATGTITVTSPKTGLTFSINGSNYTNTTGIFTGVAAGTYSLTAKNASGCISLVTSVVVNAANCSSIGNFVFRDNNGNGIQGANEPGMAGVTVRLLSNAGVVLATTSTNNNGAYSFNNLAAATYRVSFITPSGFSASPSNIGNDDTKDSDPVNGIATGIVLTSNQTNNKIDAGFIPSILALGNQVWYDEDNNGINSGCEEGMRNIAMKLYRDNDNNNVADGAAIATATTNANGYYCFVNLAPGNYIVGAIIPNGYVSSNVNAEDPDNNINNDDNGSVQLGNEIRGLAITLSIGNEANGNTNNTYDFGLLPDCNCINTSGNLLTNGSFENGTNGWTAIGGSVSSGTGYIACGSKNGFNNSFNRNSIVYQDVNIAAGTTLTFSGYAGTHTFGLFCNPKLSLVFRNPAGLVLSQTDIAITQNVDVNFGQLAFYSITATAPAGTIKVRVQSSITCDYVKMDAFCLRVNTNGQRVAPSINIPEEEYAFTKTEEPIIEKVETPIFDVLITPNPFVNFVDVSTKAKDKNALLEMRVINTNGKLMYHQKIAANSTFKINTDTWMSGIYLVEVIQGKHRKVMKVVKL
jgi:SdrD B-like domain/Secretion system C-terminal sorting domain